MSKINWYSIQRREATILLEATWTCPKCNDWFHMPYKYCKCPRI